MNDFKLDSRPNIKSGFKAPDSYFESLTDKVMLNLPVEEVKVVPLYRRRPIWVTSAAAALVLSFSLILSKNEVATAPSIPDNEVTEAYILNHMSTSELVEHLDQEDLTELQLNTMNVSDNAIEDFADFENVSTDLN